ncbi:DUF1631 domain-containing protein [Alkalisalibacterium limincola]|uniref:DUF1631 domain-containing protein n=1 Tax=Alkalisalibacterium limincola TaxID=2699169 RepID=A0A5C8KUD7_9GAMM|nr:DUF1631 domain-containing protein [Alkalisalibacterium limincola]
MPLGLPATIATRAAFDRSPVVMNPPPRTSDTSLEYPALLLRLQAQALSRIAKGFSGVLDKVDDVLFDFLQKSMGSEQQHYADAMRDVRRSRSRIEGDLVSHLEAAFNALHQGDPLDAESSLVDEAPGTLTLVSEDALEGQIAARMLAASIHRDHSALLTALDKRLGWVAGRIELNEQTNPIGPGHVAVGVHAAFRAIDIEPAVRLILFKLVERELAGTLGACYEEANRLLVQAGILPHLHRQPQAPARRPPPPAFARRGQHGRPRAGDGSGPGKLRRRGSGRSRRRGLWQPGRGRAVHRLRRLCQRATAGAFRAGPVLDAQRDAAFLAPRQRRGRRRRRRGWGHKVASGRFPRRPAADRAGNDLGAFDAAAGSAHRAPAGDR